MKILIAPFMVNEDIDSMVSVQNAIELNKDKLSFTDVCDSYQAGEPIAIDSASHSEGVWLMDVVKLCREKRIVEVANFTFLS